MDWRESAVSLGIHITTDIKPKNSAPKYSECMMYLSVKQSANIPVARIRCCFTFCVDQFVNWSCRNGSQCDSSVALRVNIANIPSCCASGSRAFLEDVSKISRISSRFYSPPRLLRVSILSINRPVARKLATYLQIVVMFGTRTSAGCRRIDNGTSAISI
jgi:hypothetical protein